MDATAAASNRAPRTPQALQRPQVIPTTERQRGFLMGHDPVRKLVILEWEMDDNILMHHPGEARKIIYAEYREVFVTDGLAGGRRFTPDCQFEEAEPQVTFVLSAPVQLPHALLADQTIVLPNTLRAMAVRNQVNRPILVWAKGRIVAWNPVSTSRRCPGVINSFAKDGSKTTVFFRASNIINADGEPCDDSVVPVTSQSVMFTARTDKRTRQVTAQLIRAPDGGPIRLRVVEPVDMDMGGSAEAQGAHPPHTG